jgi:hypothetical protein
MSFKIIEEWFVKAIKKSKELGTGIKMIQSANDNNTWNGLDNKK